MDVDVESSEGIDGLLHERSGVGRVGEIRGTGHHRGAPTLPFELAARLLQTLPVSGADGEVDSVVAQRAGDLQPDTATRSSDHGSSSCQLEVHVMSPWTG